MMPLVLLVVVGTSIWVGADASRRDWHGDSFANSATKWVIGSLLLWIVVFPVYLAKRNRAPLKGTRQAPGGRSPLVSAPTAPPAGWYRDPNDPALLRYWTGSGWTAQTAKPVS
jgi:hypothetical protein